MILPLVILLGTLLRIYKLGIYPFMQDEMLTIQKFVHIYPDLVRYWFREGHFPTYFIMMHYWMKIFGDSAVSVRFPAVISGIFSTFFIFLLGKRLFNMEAGVALSWSNHKRHIHVKRVALVFLTIILIYSPFFVRLLSASIKDNCIVPLMGMNDKSSLFHLHNTFSMLIGERVIRENRFVLFKTDIMSICFA